MMKTACQQQRWEDAHLVKMHLYQRWTPVPAERWYPGCSGYLLACCPHPYKHTWDALSLLLRMTACSSKGCCHVNPSRLASYWDDRTSGAASELGIINPGPTTQDQAPLPALTLHRQVGRG